MKPKVKTVEPHPRLRSETGGNDGSIEDPPPPLKMCMKPKMKSVEPHPRLRSETTMKMVVAQKKELKIVPRQ